jgi:hypothetical protein
LPFAVLDYRKFKREYFNVRLKRSGAWWYVENASKILASCCAKYKTTFELVVERYRKCIQALSGRKPSENKEDVHRP